MPELITLSAEGHHGVVTADVDVAAGCRIAQVTVAGRQLLVDPGDRDAQSTSWGSYPMAPWAGRVRHGQFTLFGEEHELELNRQDGPGSDPTRRHAMHGTVFTRPWTVDEVTATTLIASCSLSTPERATPSLRNFGWTFGGTARQTIELLDGQLCCHLSVEVDHTTKQSFLAEVGWHPWFRKPDQLSFHPDAMYERDGLGLPTGRLIEPSAPPWDDCFVNTAPVTLHYEAGHDEAGHDEAGHDEAGHDGTAANTEPAEFTLTLSSDCDHWVVYDGPDNATCCEPQSGPPDAFNIRPRLVTHTHPLRRTMNIAW